VFIRRKKINKRWVNEQEHVPQEEVSFLVSTLTAEALIGFFLITMICNI